MLSCRDSDRNAVHHAGNGAGLVRPGEEGESFQQEISQVNTLDIDAFIRRRGFVRDVRVYTTLDGVLHIELTQRCPDRSGEQRQWI